MDNDYDYSDYYYNRKPPKKQLKCGVFILILIFTLSFGGFILLYPHLNGKVGGITIIGSTVQVDADCYYGASMGTFTARDAAETFAVRLKSRGGAGYVMELKGEFQVFAAVYTKKADGEKVVNGLNAGTSVATLVALQTRTTEFALVDSEAAAYAAAQIKALKELVPELEKTHIAADSKGITHADAKSKCEESAALLENLGKGEIESLNNLVSAVSEGLIVAKNSANLPLVSVQLKYVSLHITCGLYSILKK